ncbi:MAG: ABC transporter substrate-binding protein, partial [Candidatus Sumerlaeia bacterium]|nr:ABC transporter substrate-binding protein [Candidatus Sumerlaeia bacterium]
MIFLSLTPGPDLSANETTPNEEDLRPVRLQLKWQHQFQFAGYYAALERGYYRDEGLDVEILEAVDDEDPVEVVTSGHAEFGIGTSELVLFRARGYPVVLLAPIFQHSPLVFLARADSGIQSIHDLVGRRVAVERQAAELFAYLNFEGIDPASIERVPHAFTPQPMIGGELDVVSAYSTAAPVLVREAGVEYL